MTEVLNIISFFLISIIVSATPLIYAASGELIVEKSGVLNLGVEGMMLLGAIASFATIINTNSVFLAIIMGALAGVFMAFLFGLLVLIFLSNQVASGLALTLFGVGLSAIIGKNYVGIPYSGVEKISIPVLSDIPFLGEIFFKQDILVLGSFILPVIIWYFLQRTRYGMILRAVGDNHHSAYSLGYSVIFIRYMAILFGGAMAGIAGAYLSIIASPHWADNMTAGKGWIALALVVFASWRTGRLMFGAYLFGGVTIAQLNAQGFGIQISSQIFSMLPYFITIIILIIISSNTGKLKLAAPNCLGQNFYPK